MNDRERVQLRPLDELMHELEQRISENEVDPEFEQREAKRAQRKRSGEYLALKRLAEAARSGIFGEVGKAIWKTATRGGDDLSEQALRDVQRQLRGRPRVK